METHSLLDEIALIKFIFFVCSVAFLVVFSVVLFFTVKKISYPLDRNLQLIGFLTYNEILMIVTSFNDYLKICMSSQLDSIDQFDSIQKMVSESKFSNKNGAKMDKVINSDENSDSNE